MSSPRRQPGGFTLLELLVATAMTAVLAGSLYATLHVAFKARRAATAAVEQMRKAELAVELIRAEVESAVVPRGILAGGFLGEDATDGAGWLNLLRTTVEEPAEEVLCRGVRSLDLKYFDGTDWQDNWDSAARDNTLPLAVEVTLQLVAEDGTSTDEGGYWVSRVFQVPCGSVAEGEQGQTAP